jgi:hypothetical protein
MILLSSQMAKGGHINRWFGFFQACERDVQPSSCYATTEAFLTGVVCSHRRIPSDYVPDDVSVGCTAML